MVFDVDGFAACVLTQAASNGEGVCGWNGRNYIPPSNRLESS